MNKNQPTNQHKSCKKEGYAKGVRHHTHTYIHHKTHKANNTITQTHAYIHI